MFRQLRKNKYILSQHKLALFSTLLRGTERKPYNLKVGDLVCNFQVKKIQEIQDFKLKSYQLEHVKTGTQYFHIDTSDQNNCMAIIFRTIPNDSKGTPHILEHLTCCGGEKYPVRDPFMKMYKRSLNTFMNAWTGPDFTAYPFSSQNAKDFQNLMQVYLDFSFKPLLKLSDFQQEGWRYDFSQISSAQSDQQQKTGEKANQANNKQEKLVYKGVVFNEMKGVYQTPENIFMENISKNLFVNTTYCHSSGGQPEDITSLTYQEVKNFFNKYYHPSNTKIFSYGDLDFQQHLQYINDNYLKNVQLLTVNSKVNNSDKIEKRKDISLQGPPETVSFDKEKQGKLAFSYLCNNIVNESFDSLGLSVLSHLLFETPSSPLYKNLIESGVAPAFCPGNGYDSQTKQAVFTIGVQGVSSKDFDAVEKIIFDTLKDVEANGIDQELIEGALAQIEVNSKMPRSNFGLALLMKLTPGLVHDSPNPYDKLDITENIKLLRNKVLNEKYLEKLVSKYLLQNNHSIRLAMTPDEHYNEKLLRNEQAKLQQIEKKLSADEIQKIKEENRILKEEQNTIEENISILPSLQISDISRKVERVNFTKSTYKDIPIYMTNQPTNGLTFIRMKSNLGEFPLFIRQYIDIFTNVFSKIGSKSKKYEQMSKLLNLYTTNFGVDYESVNDLNNVEQPNNYMVFQIAGLDRNIEKMFELFGEMLTEPDFADFQNMSTLLKNQSQEAASSIIDNSLSYATSVAAASVRESYFIKEKLAQTRFLCNMVSHFSKSGGQSEKLYIDEIDFHCGLIMQYLIRQNQIEFIVHTEEKNFTTVQQKIERLVDHFKFAYKGFNTALLTGYFGKDMFKNPYDKKYISSFYKLPMQVNYVVQTFEAPHFTHQDTPLIQLFSQIMSNEILHREIREKGGAYGSGCRVGDGVINFFSYRDPNLMQTLEAYKKSLEWMGKGEFTEENIKEAKLTSFQKIDKIIVPQDKGVDKILIGYTEEMREQYRNKIIDAKKEDIVRVANEQFIDKLKQNKFSRVVFGSDQQNLEELKNANWVIDEPVPSIKQNQ